MSAKDNQIEYLTQRVNSMQKRIAELETANAALKQDSQKVVNKINEGFNCLGNFTAAQMPLKIKYIQQIGRGTRPKANQEIINIGKIGEQTNVDRINGNITL